MAMITHEAFDGFRRLASLLAPVVLAATTLAGCGVSKSPSSMPGDADDAFRTMADHMRCMLELQRRLTEQGSSLRVTGAHPGTTATAITASSGRGWLSWIGSWGHHLVGMPAWRGALPTLYAATMDVPGNSYVGPDGFKEFFGWPTLVGRSARASDPDLARACWDASVRLSGVDLSLR